MARTSPPVKLEVRLRGRRAVRLVLQDAGWGIKPAAAFSISYFRFGPLSLLSCTAKMVLKPAPLTWNQGA